MKILIVADGRSPTTLSWIKLLQSLDIQVSLASSYPCERIADIEHFEIFPVALSSLSGSQVGTHKRRTGSQSILRKLVARFRSLIYPLRYQLGPLTLGQYKSSYLAFLNLVKPDLVHALRIPFEGMLAAYTPTQTPLIVSIWGNDLTLHAHGSAGMDRATRKTLARADGLMADTRRDIRLANEWEFPPDHPNLVVPGAGGIDLEKMQPPPASEIDLPEKIMAASKLVVNPRGFRPGSVRTDTFFAAIPIVLEREPNVIFACSAMQGQPEAIGWVERFGIQENVVLLPYLNRQNLWALFRRSQLSVSISEHDGTPNSLLEAMALGCFPIAGDIESLREWIQNGENGLLIDPSDPEQLAAAILNSLENATLRQSAAEVNNVIIRERASMANVRVQVEHFYQKILKP